MCPGLQPNIGWQIRRVINRGSMGQFRLPPLSGSCKNMCPLWRGSCNNMCPFRTATSYDQKSSRSKFINLKAQLDVNTINIIFVFVSTIKYDSPRLFSRRHQRHPHSPSGYRRRESPPWSKDCRKHHLRWSILVGNEASTRRIATGCQPRQFCRQPDGSYHCGDARLDY